MKRLLRGVIDFGDGRLSVDNQNVNYRRLSASGIHWPNPDECKIFTFVREYVQENLEPPSAAIIRDFFERMNELTVTEKLDDIKAVEVYVRTHYESLLKGLLEDQRANRVAAVLKKGTEIALFGRAITNGKKEVKLRGAEAAVDFILKEAPQLVEVVGSAKTSGDLRLDTPAGWQAYLDAKNTNSMYGKFIGIDPIDTVCHGVKRGELWIHAGFASEMKTSTAINWAYNTVTRYRGNVLYVTLEMPYDQLRRMVYTLHSSNGRFRAAGHAPLNYRSVRDGELSGQEEDFYQEVLKDFETGPYEHFEIWAPDRQVTIRDIRAYAEQLHRRMEVSLLVIDHAGLVQPTERDSNYTVRMNSVFREAKLMALHFARGEGVPVVLLHQLSREGKKEAAKNGGRYGAHALSWAHEAERSADVVTTSYLDDALRATGEFIVGNVKNRDNPHFPPVRLSVDWNSRRIYYDPESCGISIDAPEVDYDALVI